MSRASRDPFGHCCLPWGCTSSQAPGPLLLPSCPLVTQCPLRAVSVPRPALCLSSGSWEGHRFRQEEIQEAVPEAGVEVPRGLGGRVGVPQAVLALAKLPLHLSVHGL